jgi:hypothetical protein
MEQVLNGAVVSTSIYPPELATPQSINVVFFYKISSTRFYDDGTLLIHIQFIFTDEKKTPALSHWLLLLLLRQYVRHNIANRCIDNLVDERADLCSIIITIAAAGNFIHQSA